MPSAWRVCPVQSPGCDFCLPVGWLMIWGGVEGGSGMLAYHSRPLVPVCKSKVLLALRKTLGAEEPSSGFLLAPLLTIWSKMSTVKRLRISALDTSDPGALNL